MLKIAAMSPFDDMLVRVGLFLIAMLTLGCLATAFGADSRPDFNDPRGRGNGPYW